MKLGSSSNVMRATFIALVIALVGTITLIAQNEKTPAIHEPDTVGVIYYMDAATNSLVALERQTGKIVKGFLSVSVEIKLERSPVRIKEGENQDFVMNLPSGIDPNKYELFIMEVGKDKRRTVLGKAKMVTSERVRSTVAMEVKRYGSSSYRLTPAQKLPVGEYCLSPNDSNEQFCWGVDPK